MVKRLIQPVTIQITCEAEEKKALEGIAVEEGRTLSGQVRLLITQFLRLNNLVGDKNAAGIRRARVRS
jgi:hypothetical protein